jgi:hypothetical protein
MLAPAPKVTPSPPLVPESQHWLNRARQCRQIASRMQQDFAREHMLNAAAAFERNAAESREREIARGIREIGSLMHELHHGR